jgi:hypothetical protein
VRSSRCSSSSGRSTSRRRWRGGLSLFSQRRVPGRFDPAVALHPRDRQAAGVVAGRPRIATLAMSHPRYSRSAARGSAAEPTALAGWAVAVWPRAAAAGPAGDGRRTGRPPGRIARGRRPRTDRWPTGRTVRDRPGAGSTEKTISEVGPSAVRSSAIFASAAGWKGA